MGLKRYRIYVVGEGGANWDEEPDGDWLRRSDVESQMIPRPDEREAKSMNEIVEHLDGLIKGEEHHQYICDECHTSVQRSRDRVYKYKEWKAALLRLMGVE